MRTGKRLPLLLLLMGCLAACHQTAQPSAPMVEAAAAVPVSVTSPPEPATSVADEGLAVAIAREDVDRAAREQTLRVQQHLREWAREQKQAHEAAQRGDGNERCLSGQRMRRVANGWVQAGTC